MGSPRSTLEAACLVRHYESNGRGKSSARNLSIEYKRDWKIESHRNGTIPMERLYVSSFPDAVFMGGREQRPGHDECVMRIAISGTVSSGTRRGACGSVDVRECVSTTKPFEAPRLHHPLAHRGLQTRGASHLTSCRSLSGAQRIPLPARSCFRRRCGGWREALLRVDSRVELARASARQLGAAHPPSAAPVRFPEHPLRWRCPQGGRNNRAVPGADSPRPAPHEAGSCGMPCGVMSAPPWHRAFTAAGIPVGEGLTSAGCTKL